MKLFATFALLVVLELVLVGAVVCPRLVDDTKVAKAVAAYHRNPSAETKADRDKEGLRVKRTMMLFDMLLGALVVINTVAVWRTGKKLRAQVMKGPPPNHTSPSV